MFHVGDRLVGLMPANVSEGTVFSHQGLTYGGLLVSHDMTARLMLDVFDVMLAFLRSRGAQRLIYKPVPYIYFQEPTQEDLYALFHFGARLVRRDLSSVLPLDRPRDYTKGKKHNVAKARKRGLKIGRSNDFGTFFSLLRSVLRGRHGVEPVHTEAELALLAARFPEEIRLYCAYEGDQLLAGAVVFVNQTVVHTQYLANSDAGRIVGALDFLIAELINTEFCDKRYLSFGASTEAQGHDVNEGLLESKEAFGARAVVHDFYELDI